MEIMSIIHQGEWGPMLNGKFHFKFPFCFLEYLPQYNGCMLPTGSWDAPSKKSHMLNRLQIFANLFKHIKHVINYYHKKTCQTCKKRKHLVIILFKHSNLITHTTEKSARGPKDILCPRPTQMPRIEEEAPVIEERAGGLLPS